MTESGYFSFKRSTVAAASNAFSETSDRMATVSITRARSHAHVKAGA